MQNKRPLLSTGIYNSSIRQGTPVWDGEMKQQMGDVLKPHSITGQQDGQWKQHSVAFIRGLFDGYCD